MQFYVSPEIVYCLYVAVTCTNDVIVWVKFRNLLSDAYDT